MDSATDRFIELANCPLAGNPELQSAAAEEMQGNLRKIRIAVSESDKTPTRSNAPTWLSVN